MRLRSFLTGQRAGSLVGALLTAAVGWALVELVLGRGLSHLSYDLLFRLRPPVNVEDSEVVIVDMDPESEEKLNQPSSLAWGRTNHLRLLPILFGHQAQIVVFDVFFRDPQPAADAALVSMASTNNRILFAAVTEAVATPDGELLSPQIKRPFARQIGLGSVGLVEKARGAGQVIRQHYPGDPEVPSLAWKAARQFIDLAKVDPTAPRWVNYYGPAGHLPHVSFHRVFSNTVPTSLSFTGKVVYVGGRAGIPTTGGTGFDMFNTPFGEPMPGVEVNATTCLNLIRGDWLRRWPDAAEQLTFIAFGLIVGFGLTRARPFVATLVGGTISIAVLAAAYTLFVRANVWIPWIVASIVQVPCAIGWSVLIHTRRLTEEKQALEARLASARLTKPIAVTTGSGSVPADPSTSDPTLVSSDDGTRRVPGISDHSLVRCVGRGAYGEVWLARDVIGTFHAVKIVYRDSFDRDEPFEREFRGLQKYTPISRTHPGLVHVLHIGRNNAQCHFFCIMEAGDDEVTGQQIDPNTYQPRTLARQLKQQGPLQVYECVRVGMALAEALDHLHQRKLIHRDIKPSNVIFVRGAPKFADIGLVTDLTDADHDVSYVGTSGYIAPEGPGTAAADVYSLGKLLYEASTGRDRREFPELPTILLDEPEDSPELALADIIRRACADDPKERYTSAAALRDDLATLQQRLKTGRPAG